MFLFGINVLIILTSMVGASINWIIDRQVDYHKLIPAFWLGLFFCFYEEIHWYPIAGIVGFIAGRYCARLGEYVERKLKGYIARKRWGRFIHKKK